MRTKVLKEIDTFKNKVLLTYKERIQRAQVANFTVFLVGLFRTFQAIILLLFAIQNKENCANRNQRFLM